MIKLVILKLMLGYLGVFMVYVMLYIMVNVIKFIRKRND